MLFKTLKHTLMCKIGALIVFTSSFTDKTEFGRVDIVSMFQKDKHWETIALNNFILTKSQGP